MHASIVRSPAFLRDPVGKVLGVMFGMISLCPLSHPLVGNVNVDRYFPVPLHGRLPSSQAARPHALFLVQRR